MSAVNSRWIPPSLDPIEVWMRREEEISETMSCMARVLMPPWALRVLPCMGSGEKRIEGENLEAEKDELYQHTKRLRNEEVSDELLRVA
jgi:hypothetical protein